LLLLLPLLLLPLLLLPLLLLSLLSLLLTADPGCGKSGNESIFRRAIENALIPAPPETAPLAPAQRQPPRLDGGAAPPR
jgi:hypothetical protein